MSDPTISDNFNQGSQYMTFAREGDCPSMLVVSYPYQSIRHIYDFAARLLTTRYDHNVAVTPFSQLDPESLMALRDKLVELKGNPPPLPAPAAPPSAKGALQL